MEKTWWEQLLDQAKDERTWPQGFEVLKKIPWKDKITEADLVGLKDQGERLVPFLLQARDKKNASNRASLLLGLIESPTCIAPLKLLLLDDDNSEAQRWAAMTLMRVGDVAFPIVQSILETTSDEPARCLLSHTALFWDSDNIRTAELIEIVVQLFLNSVADSKSVADSGKDDAGSLSALRTAAANALMAHGVNEGSAVQRLRPLLSNDGLLSQLQTAGILARGGVEVEQAIDLAIGGLDADDPKLRVLAARVLGRMGESASRAVPALLDHLDEQDGYASMAIKKSLVMIGPIGIPKIVEVMNRHANPQVRARCAAVLSGPAAVAAFGDLHRLAVHDPDDDVRFRASRALRRIKPKENPAYLEAILVNSDHGENGSYRWRGGKIAHQGTYVVGLWNCLVSNDADVREATFELVRKFQLHQKEPLAEWWCRGLFSEHDRLVNDDPQMIRRRLEALTLLDQHLNLHETFLQQCAEHDDDSINRLARQLLSKLN